MLKTPSALNATPISVVIVAMDTHFAGAIEQVREELRPELPGLSLSLHAASEWSADARVLARCRAAIATADIVIAGMLFMEDHFLAVLGDIEARRERNDATVCVLSAKEVVRLTRLGRLDMSRSSGGALSFLKKLRGKGAGQGKAQGGSRQMAMLRRLPRILRLIPGTAQDLRVYFLALQYWLGGSRENLGNLVRLLVHRYADGPRLSLRGAVEPAVPIDYPDVGLYHPRLPGRIAQHADALPRVSGAKGTVGLLVMRSYLLAGNTEHYDGVIASLERQGLDVRPAFASGLDARPAMDAFFTENGCATIDALVSLTGFSLIGGPAYNDAKSAEEVLAKLDVPYLAAHPAEFQTLEQWGASARGLMPVEATMMVSIPELDGATSPTLFGGRSDGAGEACTGCERACVFPVNDRQRAMHSCSERADRLAARVAKLVALRRSKRAARRVGVVLFNFPPNAGSVGSAAYLSVFASLWQTLRGRAREGYTVELPTDPEALRDRILGGNAARYGASANVHAAIPADEHVRREAHLAEIEAQWGPAPGRHNSDGRSIFVLGERFGNVFVGVQPAFGVEGDPMRLLFESSFAPTHAFAAFYRWLREDFAVDAVLHFGTHGALEFMPGKQTGLSGRCWPDRLIADLPNLYLYAANNPSEGALAKRRTAATLISYRTPPVAHSGLYRGLIELKSGIEQWRLLPPEAAEQRAERAVALQAQAAALDLCTAEPRWTDAAAAVATLAADVLELEYTLIPHGLHTVGVPPSKEERTGQLVAIADASHDIALVPAAAAAIVAGEPAATVLSIAGLPAEPANLAAIASLASVDAMLAEDHEVPAIIRALDGRFIRPAPGGDLLRTPDVLPTGRNVHGFDPFKLPSAYACTDGARQAERLLARHAQDSAEQGGAGLPETVAIVLWGTDCLKTEGAPIGTVLALLGARPRFDSYGRLAGAELLPLGTMERPRIDVMVTMSGIFRDLLPLQIRLLAEAALLAAEADEPTQRNFVRKHALAFQAAHGGDLRTAALRVFGNAEGAYGANVNHLLESGCWQDEDELADAYMARKGFAYAADGRPAKQATLLDHVLKGVEASFQNLDSVELGVTTIDNYFDTLGGISRAVRRARGGEAAPVYIGDATVGKGQVRSLSEQVALETRTRILNPKWYEGMLKHGYEGVRQIETHVTNTVGWSATTGEVQPWVYQKITETFVLDPYMRDRLASLNPTAAAKLADRLMEAQARNYWTPDAATLRALQEAGDELEDRLEGVGPAAAVPELVAAE